jgi:catechol 2,3-dioxygenase-like lactoylglutathione lyase family enzyme
MVILPGLPRQVVDALTSPSAQARWLGGTATTAAHDNLAFTLSAEGLPAATIQLRPILGAVELHATCDGDAGEWDRRFGRLRLYLAARTCPRLHLIVDDLRRSEDFYHLLGWEAVRAYSPDESYRIMVTPGGSILMLAGPGSDVYQHVDAACRELPRNQGLSLLEPGLVAIKERLTAAGHPIESEQVEAWGDRTLKLRDPDGYRVILIEPKRLTDEEIIALYLDGARLVAALQSLSTDQLEAARAEGKWSVRELAHHLVTVELLSIGQLMAGIAEPDKPFRRHPWLPDDYARGLGNATRPLGTDLALFDLTRRHIAGLLAHLPHAWNHVILRDNAPPTTVRNMIHQLATHTLHHLEQIEASLS